MFRKLSTSMALLFVVTSAGCLGAAPTGGPNPTPAPAPGEGTTGTGGSDPLAELGIAPGNYAGGKENTHDHEQNDIDPFEVLTRIQELGAPEISTRMHSCQKMKYATLGTVLTQLGVNLARNAAAGTPQSAGQLYRGGAGALGGPNYQARIAEAIEITTAGATKLFDIFVQAAPEVITAMPTNDFCKVGTTLTPMFDTQGKCTLAGISCLQGSPASQAQKDLCDQVLTEASSPAIGQAIAVSTIMAAAHTCE
jgi:hypothetical protein